VRITVGNSSSLLMLASTTSLEFDELRLISIIFVQEAKKKIPDSIATNLKVFIILKFKIP
jgi:hypothetical protein